MSSFRAARASRDKPLGERYLDKDGDLRVVSRRGHRLQLRQLRGADFPPLQRGRGQAQPRGTVSGALAAPPQHLLYLVRGLADDTVLIRLLHFGETRAQELLELVYLIVFELATALLVVTLVPETATLSL